MAQVATTLGGVLEQARGFGASDLHLSAGSIPFLRVEGEMVRLDEHGELDASTAAALATEACGLAGIDPGNDVDFCFDLEGLGRFRANLFSTIRGAGMALKCIPQTVESIEDLGLPDSLAQLTYFRTGMVLVTGATNSGKTSTLAALLKEINSTRREHVVTIEDPIEHVFDSDQCNITQRQVGPHTASFESALRAALREDPDVILVSELRDVETIRTAIVAAETGHLVLGTLHTRGAASTVTRLLDAFPAKEQEQIRTMVAASLRTVVSQRLLPRAAGGRRVPAYEILHISPAVANLIREGRTHQIDSQLQLGRRIGMIDIDTRLQEMVSAGLISVETAKENARNPARFADGH
ncbi:MAG: type IV pilus twitching motility protein PilT [Planctomycetota bacterium]